jgi:hypothetical protein
MINWKILLLAMVAISQAASAAVADPNLRSLGGPDAVLPPCGANLNPATMVHLRMNRVSPQEGVNDDGKLNVLEQGNGGRIVG